MQQPEAWLRGPIAGIDPVLMPAAHALLQTIEDTEAVASDLTTEQVWADPGSVATVGFHLRHIVGATDRLLTYARGEKLNEQQRAALAAEKQPGDPPSDAASLVAGVRRGLEAALDQLRHTPAAQLQEPRTVGRAAVPTTVMGLLFHAAEHAQRHAGQLVTTVKLLRARSASSEMTDETRAYLRELRERLLHLHKVLLDDAKAAYEMDRGRVGSNANLLQLVINDPWFAWLHAVSELIVRIDQAVESNPPAPESDAGTLVEQVEKLLTASEHGEGFQKRYYEALQRQPAVVLAHADVRRLLKTRR